MKEKGGEASGGTFPSNLLAKYLVEYGWMGEELQTVPERLLSRAVHYGGLNK